MGFLSRRAVLRAALGGAGLVAASAWRRAVSAAEVAPAPLEPPDANGLRLLPGFTSRIVARAEQPPLPGGSFRWHASPDGGAVFAAPDRGWIYVSNSELPDSQGGVGALRFDARGGLSDAYPILAGTTRNCAGGATPWGTWLSCEEIPLGRVWECDPFGKQPAAVRPALGVFSHEAAAVDRSGRRLYLTEDDPAGRFYRFTPASVSASGAFDLTAGRLEVAQVAERPGGVGGPVSWLTVPDPGAARTPTRQQVPASTVFAGGEGIGIRADTAYFTTKYDNRVWAYDLRREVMDVLYDDDRYEHPVLTGVDNVAITPAGSILVAEDGGHMQLVVIVPGGPVYPILQVVDQDGSELTGPAFDPAGERLYFSSQRGPHGLLNEGITYEVRGPFRSV